MCENKDCDSKKIIDTGIGYTKIGACLCTKPVFPFVYAYYLNNKHTQTKRNAVLLAK